MYPIVGGSGRVAFGDFQAGKNEGKKSGAQHKNESNAGHPPQNSDKNPPGSTFPSAKSELCPQPVLSWKYHWEDVDLLIGNAKPIYELLPGAMMLICGNRIDHDEW